MLTANHSFQHIDVMLFRQTCATNSAAVNAAAGGAAALLLLVLLHLLLPLLLLPRLCLKQTVRFILTRGCA